ncbi:MAG: septal ring lytic transglycosylase RlpA family protein [Pseudomonadota bacterium]|nr:septal ring lytic transglycosylase RlpA family protein [Pseudomonadota bacterium]
MPSLQRLALAGLASMSLLRTPAFTYSCGRGVVSVALLCLALTACGQREVRELPPVGSEQHGQHRSGVRPPRAPRDQDAAPVSPRDVSNVPEAVPKPEPRARYGNHSPYTVLGRSYSVLPSAQGYVERGIASWYGVKFHGRLTSTREPYDIYQMTAAHKTLPLPSYVRVTNLETGKNLLVRVNDRGPFHENRIIDLSYAAAVQLGIQAKGTGLVEVRAIDPAHPEQDSAAVRPSIGLHRVYVQVGAFDDRDNARRLKERLEELDFDDVFLDRVLVSGRVLHRVRIGPARDTAEADALTTRLAGHGLTSVNISID